MIKLTIITNCQNTETVHILFLYIANACFYDSLEHSAIDSGSVLGPFLNDKTSYECQEECDDNPQCNSIRMCDNGCSLFNKRFSKNTPIQSQNQANPKNCFTLFKTCPGGKNCILISGIA